MKKKLVLSLGSNLGNRYAYIRQAITYIEECFAAPCVCSSYYTTPPWGETEQAQFINMALYIETHQSMDKCLTQLQAIELKMGRVKTKKWGPRSIDIDILFYEDNQVTTEALTVPHPHMHERVFVLKPVCDIVPDFFHPVLKVTMKNLLRELVDDSTLFCN